MRSEPGTAAEHHPQRTQRNPYSAPQDRSAAGPRSAIVSRVPLTAVAVAAAAYHAFILLLLSSGSGDQQAGMLLLINSPVFAIWLMGLWRHSGMAWLPGVLGAIIQAGLYVVMAAPHGYKVNDLFLINFTLTVGFLLLAGLCFRYRRFSHDQRPEFRG